MPIVQKKNTFDFKKITELYNSVYKKLDSLSDKQLEKEEERINSLQEKDKEDIFSNLVSQLTDPDNYRIELKELKKIVKEYIPDKSSKSLSKKVKKNINNKSNKNNNNVSESKYFKNQVYCLNKFKDVKEDKDNSSEWGDKQYTAKLLNGKSVYIKQQECNYLTKYKLETIKEEIILSKNASKLKITANLLDTFLCKGKDGNYNVFFVYENIEGVSLTKYKDENKIDSAFKKKIQQFIDKLIKNGILLDYVNQKKLMIIGKGKNKQIILTSLKSAKTVDELVKKETNSMMERLEWLTKSTDKIRDLTIKSLIREKIDFKL